MERNHIVMIVARNIESAMARKGTNAAEVARRSNLNHTAVYDILKGKSQNPRLDTLHKIAVMGLGMPLSALMVEPSDDELDQEIAEAIGLMPVEERRRILSVARAFLPTKPAS